MEDGIGLTQYLRKHLNREKVILIGTTWGSIVGAKMALAHPELFHAYLGHAQFVSFKKNLGYAYQKVLQLANNSSDQPSLNKLEALGEPPNDDAILGNYPPSTFLGHPSIS